MLDDGDPIDAAALRARLVGTGRYWQRVDVVPETASTNADLAARARAGEQFRTVLVTGNQTAGRGRLGRTWSAPPGTNVALSVLVQPRGVHLAAWTWIPLFAGVAVAQGLEQAAVARGAALRPALKWPNDVLIGDGKVCGILVERVDTPSGPACVIGIGINVHLTADQLPVPTATSLALVSGPAVPTRDEVAAEVADALSDVLSSWEEGRGRSLSERYRELCTTLGRRVRVQVAGDRFVTGLARDIDADGRLVVETAEGDEVLSAGDVVHVR